METVIKVEGMMCTHCKARVEKICKAIPGTEDAVVDLAAKTVTITGLTLGGSSADASAHTFTGVFVNDGKRHGI